MAKQSAKVPGESADQPDQPTSTEPVSAAQVAELIRHNVELERRLEAAGKPRKANAYADLPDQDDIDVSLLKTPVLTKQGWLVPEKFGSSQTAPK